MNMKKISIIATIAIVLSSLAVLIPINAQNTDPINQMVFNNSAVVELKATTVTVTFRVASTQVSYPIICEVTIQDPTNKVDAMMSCETTITSHGQIFTFSHHLKSEVKGTWTATIMLFGADGVTALAVNAQTFTV